MQFAGQSVVLWYKRYGSKNTTNNSIFLLQPEEARNMVLDPTTYVPGRLVAADALFMPSQCPLDNSRLSIHERSDYISGTVILDEQQIELSAVVHYPRSGRLLMAVRRMLRMESSMVAVSVTFLGPSGSE